jgi:hypothetical protein
VSPTALLFEIRAHDAAPADFFESKFVFHLDGAIEPAEDDMIESTEERRAWGYPTIELQGRLHDIFTVTHCQYISGLSCRISYNGRAPLPSEMLFVPYDVAGKTEGPRVRVIYPRLEPGESGTATFRIGSHPARLVLRGVWDGPWRDPY